MLIARSLADLACHLSALGEREARALVPTMGALHGGHCALVEVAAGTGAAVVASVFVNPLQFAPGEDLARYPRDEAADLAALAQSGCDLAWLPSVAEMYAADDATTVEVAGPAEHWEGEHRPGHFRGVATVVAKLFGQIRPDLAVFGEKDWQQLQVLRRMVADLWLPVRIVGVPTVREPDGLALSSRNRFLTAEERSRAPQLYAALTEAAGRLAAGEAASAPLQSARERLRGAGFGTDYLALVDGPTLQPLAEARTGARLIAAARLGSVRLLDNVAV
ncbi:MAG: pantoate--beta-alanine ligase [Alphaproteobacteria bacterium]|nr:pantoate--beta-alanine ligase [Alphaproteobacteria bacterium]